MRGDVVILRAARCGKRRILAANVAAFAVVAGLSTAFTAALSEETNPLPADASAADTATADSAPFSGNLELKARLDGSAKLTVAGERLHLWLLRRFYAAHGYQTMWDA